MEHRRAEPRRQRSRTCPSYHGDGDVQRRHWSRSRTTCRCGRTCKAQLRHRRRRACISIASTWTPTARSRVAAGDVDLGALARADLPGASRACISAHARDLLRERERGSSTGDGDFTGMFHLFKGGHDLTGDVHQRARRRERLPLSGAVRLAALDAARASRSTNAGSQFYGGDARVQLRRSSRSASRRGRRRGSTRRTPTSTCAQFTDFDAARRACGSPAARRGRNLLEWPLGRSASIAATGRLSVDAARRRRRR